VTAVLSIFLVCSGGGVAAHALSDMETGHQWHSLPTDVAVLVLSSLVFLAGMLLY
jgi:hypothetical protein